MERISIKKNAMYLMGDKIIKILFGFFISVAIARYFGSENLGKINYVLAYLGFFEVVSIFGMDSILMKDIGLSEDKKKVSDALSTIMIFRVAVYFLTLPIWYFIFINYLNDDNTTIILFVIFSLDKLLNSIIVAKIFLQAKGLNKEEAITSQIVFCVGVILKSVLIVTGGNLYHYASIVVLEKLLFSLLILKKVKEHQNISLSFDLKFLKRIVRESYPLLFSSMAIFIYMKVDQIMIGKMLSIKEVGVYSVGVKLSELIYFVPMAISTAYFPKILDAKKTKIEEEYRNEFSKLGQINISICLIYSIGATIFGKWFVELVYGVEYIQAGTIFKIYSWASIFVALAVSTGKYLVLENKQKLMLQSTLGGAFINIILNFIFIKKFGIKAGAITTLISYLYSTYFYFYFLNDKSYFIIRKNSFKLTKLVKGGKNGKRKN